MRFSPHVSVRVDLARVRRNVLALRQVVGVPILAVIKADAYGLGAAGVACRIKDKVSGFCLFSLHDQAADQLWRLTSKPVYLLGPPTSRNADDYLSLHIHPAVVDIEQARALKAAQPTLCVETGMHRLACRPEDVRAALVAGDCPAAFTHAVGLKQVDRLLAATAEAPKPLIRHAAGSSLLKEPAARLDAVRPGLALYRGAVRVSTRLIEVHHQAGPAGYTGFISPTGCHGIILAGYSNGLRRGPCMVGGRQATVLEVGMQTAYVSVDPRDKAGDEVVILGDGLTEDSLAEAWGGPPQMALVQACSMGRRQYVS